MPPGLASLCSFRSFSIGRDLRLYVHILPCLLGLDGSAPPSLLLCLSFCASRTFQGERFLPLFTDASCLTPLDEVEPLLSFHFLVFEKGKKK